MTREELLKELRAMPGGDLESEHLRADKLLLAFINDQEITEAFEDLDRWYA